MRGRKWSWSEKILFLTPFLFVLMAMATFLVPRDRVFRPEVWKRVGLGISFRARESNCNQGPMCASNLKQIGLGMLMYAQDNDERFPPVASSGKFYGWVDALDPYLKSRRIFYCPQAATAPTTSPRLSGYSSYYFNSHLSAKTSDGQNQNRVILMGEGDDGLDLSDARYSKSNLPSKWEKNLKSPLFRHLSEEVWATRGSYFAFGDGHVKFLSPADIRRDGWTFQPQ